MIPLYKVHMPEGVDQDVANVLYSGQITTGPNVSLFEKLFGDYLDNRLVTTTSDASSSMMLCLYLAGVRPGDNVIMSPLVCLSTSTPVRNLFAHIRWCDVDPRTGNIDSEDLVNKIDSRTKAIVIYHWAGNPADLDSIHEVAQNAGLAIIEDAGEALGAEYRGKKIGATGADYTVFSFYPNRQITTIEGAAISFAREEEYEDARRLKKYGIHQPSFRGLDGEINPASDILVAGWNACMNHVAATIGVAQMDHIQRIVERHRDNGIFYDQALSGVPGLEIIERPHDSLSAYWVYTFLADDRDELLGSLHRKGIQASKVHVRNDVYTAFGNQGARLPGVETFTRAYLSIPCGWWVSIEDRAYIVESIKQAMI